MKVKRLLSIILCIFVPFIFIGCKEDESSNMDDKSFNVNNTKQFISKLDSAQEEFFKILYDVDVLEENMFCSCVGNVLDGVGLFLDSYSMILSYDDAENPKIKQIDYGFIYNHKSDLLQIECNENFLYIKIQDEKDSFEVRAKKLNKNSYAITIYDEESLSGLQTIFTGAIGRVKIDEHISGYENIFTFENFDNFAKEDGKGNYKSNE